jgi:hypothetical protein
MVLGHVLSDQQRPDCSDVALLSMPKRPKDKQPPVPRNNTAAPDKSVISQYMAQIGSKGGKIGGKRRLQTMSDKQRRDAAAKAASARWSKSKKKSK